MSASRWTSDENIKAILVALTPQNRLACEVSYRYGLRIGDVLNLKTELVRLGRFSIREEKTNKLRRITVDSDLQARMLSCAGKVYIFESRTDWRKHRTRQAVYKDIVRASKIFRLKGVTTHSLRKCYAVDKLREFGDIKRVQRLLNHSSEAITMIYALSDMSHAK